VATYHAISAVGQAIVALLKTGRSTPEFGSTEVRLFHARDFQKGLEEGVSVYLYRVTVSGARRSLPPTHSGSGRQYRQPLPVDLYYLVTPWAKTAEMQHLILAWSMRTIEVRHHSLRPCLTPTFRIRSVSMNRST
jgi:Pvc16 N-terminal domain